MIHYLENNFWDDVIDGVYSIYHKFMNIVYPSYCNILSSSHIVLSSRSHGVWHSDFSYNQLYHTHTHTHTHTRAIAPVQNI